MSRHEPSWPVKFGCLEWSSEGYLKSGGLWVSKSRRPLLRRSSGEASGLCRLRAGFAGFFCRRRPAQWRFPVAREFSGRWNLAGIFPALLFRRAYSAHRTGVLRPDVCSPIYASDSDYDKEISEYVKEEKKRKQMEAVAEDLFNTEKGRRRGVAGSLQGLLRRG
ncbi:hypothetical protein Cgig2_003289 [Carnegiea gigantea]|uniref:Uncharacterized protein n=1 Tax=Carnegiea gigantea TaxID=171969 RepID=A0A9Q1JQ53_9CARY|nr:hypothetical protein Cgig2_003289 [Carnegiea gigantea]